MTDPHTPTLDRFLTAQERVYPQALAEIKRGRKLSHWMWFIFPQLAGLGRSETARYYGIQGIAHARAYLADAVLGARLREITAALLALPTSNADAVFGSVDALKLRSCFTLFAAASKNPAVFQAALDKFFSGEPDPQTVQRLGSPEG